MAKLNKVLCLALACVGTVKWTPPSRQKNIEFKL